MTYPLHGGQLHNIAAHFNIPTASLLDLSANINPDGPAPGVLTALRAALDDPATLTDYPDLQLRTLKQSIAGYADLTPSHISVANGFVPLLEAALRALNVRRCLVPMPAFVEYRRTLECLNVEVLPLALDPASDFPYDPIALTSGPHDAVLLANPQNPSGVAHTAGQMHDLLAAAAARNIRVLLDEAFIDYLPEHSLTAAVDAHPNLIVFRSVTKFHAVPGLRVAYAVSHPTVAAALDNHLAPWPITTLAAHAVTAALADPGYPNHTITTNLVRREALLAALSTLPLRIYPATANYILFQIPATFDPHTFWTHLITHHRIVLRACANYESLPPGHFRTAVRTPEENHRLLTALTCPSSSLIPSHL